MLHPSAAEFDAGQGGQHEMLAALRHSLMSGSGSFAAGSLSFTATIASFAGCRCNLEHSDRAPGNRPDER